MKKSEKSELLKHEKRRKKQAEKRMEKEETREANGKFDEQKW